MRLRGLGPQACAHVPQVRAVDVFPLREEVPATRLMSSALWLRGRLVVPRFAPAEQLAGIFEEHAQARRAWRAGHYMPLPCGEKAEMQMLEGERGRHIMRGLAAWRRC